MTDFFSTVAAKEVVPCSERDFDCLNRALMEEQQRLMNVEGVENFIQAEYNDGEGVFIFAENYFGEDDLTDNICKLIGEFLKTVGFECLEFGVAQFASKVMVGSHAGYRFRINNNGDLLYPTMDWPENK